MKLFTICLSLLCFSTPGLSDTIFNDGFEDGLGAWPISSHGIVVSDPMSANNQVLSFNGTHAAGDVFSSPIPVSISYRYVLKFDYLGVVGNQSQPDNLGGYIGISDSTRSQLQWLCATELCDSAFLGIVDDSQWHSYAFEFSPHEYFSAPFTSIRIMVEDWNGNAGQCPPDNIWGDVFFDNIELIRFDPVPNTVSSWGEIKTLYD